MGGAQTQTGAAVTIEDVFCVEGEIILYVQGGVWTQHIPETLLLVPETLNSERVARQLETVAGQPGAVDVIVDVDSGRIHAIGAYRDGRFSHLWGTILGGKLLPAPALSPHTLTRIVNGQEAGMVLGTGISEVTADEVTLRGGRAWVGGVNYHIPSTPTRIRAGEGGEYSGGDGRVHIAARGGEAASWTDAVEAIAARKGAWGRIVIASDGAGGGVWLYDHGGGQRELVVAVRPGC